jgi:hypothetical protein
MAARINRRDDECYDQSASCSNTADDAAPRRRAAADAMRRLWSFAKKPQRDGQVTSIAKGMLTSERFKGLDHVVAMQFDAIERETPIEVVEEFWMLGATLARTPSTRS